MWCVCLTLHKHSTLCGLRNMTSATKVSLLKYFLFINQLIKSPDLLNTSPRLAVVSMHWKIFHVMTRQDMQMGNKISGVDILVPATVKHSCMQAEDDIFHFWRIKHVDKLWIVCFICKVCLISLKCLHLYINIQLQPFIFLNLCNGGLRLNFKNRRTLLWHSASLAVCEGLLCMR